MCLDLCAALAAEGEDVTVFTTSTDFPRGTLDVPLMRPVAKDGYTIYYYPVSFRPYLFSYSFFRGLDRRIEEFDIIHIHGLYRFPQAIAAYLARKRQIPYIVRPHGSLDPFLYHNKRHRRMKRLYERIIEFPSLNRATAIHYTTQEEQELVRELGLQVPGVLLPNGIHTKRFDLDGPRGVFRRQHGLESKKVILFFGRINFKKGLDILVDAFALLAAEMDDVHLVIAGPDNESYGKKVKRWLREKGVQDKVVFTGMLVDAEAQSVLRDADVFVLPSYSENFGNSVVEAMAMELPVVISDRVNIWREVDEANAGLIIGCNVDDLRRALQVLLQDKRKRRTMGENGRKLTETTFDWKSIIPRMKEIYAILGGTT